MAIKDDNLTRKERRDQARAEREALERQAAAETARRRRLTQLGGVLALAIVVIVVIVVASGGGGNSPSKIKPGQVVPGASQAQALFAGVPEHGTTLGNPNAPVTLAEYVDLQCPVCQAYAVQTFPSLVQQYVRTGKVQVQFHTLPVIAGPDGTTAQSQGALRFALAVGQQNLLFPFAELMYENQQREGSGYLTTSYLQTIAGGISGLNAAAATAAMNSTAVSNQFVADNAFARAHRANATPTFFVGKTGGQLNLLSAGALPLSDFTSAFSKLGV